MHSSLGWRLIFSARCWGKLFLYKGPDSKYLVFCGSHLISVACVYFLQSFKKCNAILGFFAQNKQGDKYEVGLVGGLYCKAEGWTPGRLAVRVSEASHPSPTVVHRQMSSLEFLG